MIVKYGDALCISQTRLCMHMDTYVYNLFGNTACSMRHHTQPRNPSVSQSHARRMLSLFTAASGRELSLVYPFGGRRANKRDFLKLEQGKVKKIIIKKEKELKNGGK